MLAVVRASRPEFRSREDALAYAIYGYVLTQDFKLVACGAAAEDDSQDFTTARDEVDTTGWNALDGLYAFRFQDINGRRPPLYIKCLPVGNILLVHWVETSSSSDTTPLRTLELDLDTYTTGQLTPTSAYNNIEKLTALVDSHLKPKTAQQQSLPTTRTTTTDKATTSGRRADEEETHRSILEEERRGGNACGIYYPGQQQQQPGGGLPAYGVGMEDVVPPGFHAPGLPPEHGGVLGGLIQGPPMHGGGGGMHVGPGHPMFGPGRYGGGGVGELPGGRGGGGSSLPPGARWDPINPPGMRGFQPDDFVPDRTGRPHPDVMHRPDSDSTDWDNYFG